MKLLIALQMTLAKLVLRKPLAKFINRGIEVISIFPLINISANFDNEFRIPPGPEAIAIPALIIPSK